jgi:hypothetical protein
MSFFGMIILGVLFLTILRAVMRIMENMEKVEDTLVFFDKRKIDRPVAPSTFVPLEKI